MFPGREKAFIAHLRMLQFAGVDGKSFLQAPFLYLLSLCTFFFEKKVRKKAIREESRNPLKSSRRRLSAASALPKQRRKCSSNLKVFLIVRSFFACGDGEKARKFAFLEKDKQCRVRVSLPLLASPARLASQTSKSRPARLSSTIYKTSRPRRDGERKIHKKERKTAPLMKI